MEKKFSMTELIEMAYSEGYSAAQREFSKKSKKDEDNYKLGDKVNIGMMKALNPKGYNKAIAEAYGDEQNFNRLAKWNAGMGAGVGGTLGAIGGAVVGGKKGAAIGGVLGAAGTAGAEYVGTKLGGAMTRGIRKVSRSADENYYRLADRAAVASGDMSKEEYLRRHRRSK